MSSDIVNKVVRVELKVPESLIEKIDAATIEDGYRYRQEWILQASREKLERDVSKRLATQLREQGA